MFNKFQSNQTVLIVSRCGQTLAKLDGREYESIRESVLSRELNYLLQAVMVAWSITLMTARAFYLAPAILSFFSFVLILNGEDLVEKMPILLNSEFLHSVFLISIFSSFIYSITSLRFPGFIDIFEYKFLKQLEPDYPGISRAKDVNVHSINKPLSE